MQNYAITHNLTPFISMQNQYSLAYREEEREMMPTLKVRSYFHLRRMYAKSLFSTLALARFLTHRWPKGFSRVQLPVVSRQSVGRLTCAFLAQHNQTHILIDISHRLLPKYLKNAEDKEIVNRCVLPVQHLIIRMLIHSIFSVEAIAKKRGVSMAQVALAWVMQNDAVSAPVIGATTVEKLQDLAGAFRFIHLLFKLDASTDSILWQARSILS